MGIAFDSGANRRLRTWPGLARADRRPLACSHLSESDRGTPGSGNVYWDEVFSGLGAIGYWGDLVMESFVALNPDIARATCMWRPVVENPAYLVREGLAFLRSKARSHGLPG
ncbi:hypothetical protein [Calidithermus roseus]|uniref:D-tagatose 3-epimerase n=1 Tax=Calidithermus roseus TaxID=1644118 RepID=A0A399EY84_9DEIN|nr:hypothetical protein [Calidithermus roseus]RIH87251.1 D-tagatose 3-epimerase [Calidithermus roseus]